MALTRQLVAQIQREINESLAAVAAKHNLTLEPSRARYSDSNLRICLELNAQTENGEPADFRYGAAALCLPADCWGKTVMINGRTMKISSIKLRNRKYPVIALYQGKTFKLTSESVARALKAAA